jgi:hypothetical protein
MGVENADANREARPRGSRGFRGALGATSGGGAGGGVFNSLTELSATSPKLLSLGSGSAEEVGGPGGVGVPLAISEPGIGLLLNGSGQLCCVIVKRGTWKFEEALVSFISLVFSQRLCYVSRSAVIQTDLHFVAGSETEVLLVSGGQSAEPGRHS